MPDLTPAETLRKAAGLMEKLAKAATPDPWATREKHGRDIADEGYSDVRVVSDRGDVAVTYLSGVIEGDYEDAEFIASMGPQVGLALAALLDKTAWMLGLDPDLIGRVGVGETLTLARLILGEGSHA